jgi:hypothetical protein
MGVGKLILLRASRAFTDAWEQGRLARLAAARRCFVPQHDHVERRVAGAPPWS